MDVRETIVMNETNAYEEPANGGTRPDRGQPDLPQVISCSPNPPRVLNAEWLASLSHELRSPLTAIQGYASMLLRHHDRISPEERQEFLQAISQSSNRMADVLDRFLDIANLEAGMVQLHPQPIDMSQLVQEVLLAKQQECPDNNASLTFKQVSDPTVPMDQQQFIINADGLLIHKMLIQLLDNAQKYSAPCTPIEVTLSSTSLSRRDIHIPPQIRAQLLEQGQGQGHEHEQGRGHEHGRGHEQEQGRGHEHGRGHEQGQEQGHEQGQGQEQGWRQGQGRGQAPPLLVELSIQDHGIGIPRADHERIFERFERVDVQLTREVSGLGLGLTMCKYVVALHNGAIWVESTPGEGSTFYVLFPAFIQERKQTRPLQPPTT